MPHGCFITLEGGEGVGKSTQALAIANALRLRKLSAVVTREPGGTPGAESIRTLLMDGSIDRWSRRTEALLFAAARADHVQRVIEPALALGQWVICDRYVDSSRAYQAGEQDISDDDVVALHAFGSRGLLPDRTLVLTLNSAEGGKRAAARDSHDDRFVGRDGETLAARFRKIAERESERVRLIDASGSAVEVTQRALAALADLLP